MKESFESILQKIPSKTQIIAVSKKQSIQQIEALYQRGQRHFAENYVQEALQKLQQIKHPDIYWHFIGKLQSNKAKDVVGSFEYIHSVDSFHLAEVIQKIALKEKLVQKILIQVNIANEESKGGIHAQELPNLLAKIQPLSNVKVVGLMTMPPLVDDPEKSRPYFQELKKLMTGLQKKYPDLRELSMGTSSDYSAAAEEGATFIRLGTILFGERKN